MKPVLSTRANEILIYILTLLIPMQIYFPAYRGKYVTIFMALALVLFLGGSGMVKVRQLLKDKILFYGLFWLMILASFFYSGDKADAFKHVFILGLGLPIYYVYQGASRQKAVILKIFLFGSLPLALFIILLFINDPVKLRFLGFPWLKIFIEPKGLQAILDKAVVYNVLYPHKEGGFFLNANDASIYMCFATVAAGWLALTEKNKAIYLVAGIIFILGLVFTGSNSGIYSFFIALTIVTVLYFSRRTSLVKVMLVLILVLGVSYGGIKIFTAMNPRYDNSQFKYLGDNLVLHNRLPIWRASIEVIKQHPWFGVGLDKDNWNSYYRSFAPKYKALPDTTAHNMYLSFWAKSGILALLFMLLFLFSNIKYNLRRFYQSNELFGLAAVCVLIPLIIVGMTEAIPLMEIRIIAAFFMFLGLS
ncbi:MAG: O-antigen ligase family protein [bacterium]|nr:O-antigen ligase family protein [bacterium]